jgi:predicted dehydrogenase
MLISEGAIGVPRSFEFLWGEIFDWPAASGFYFGKAAEGRGVLFDKGPHVLDALCWWLPGEAAVLSCYDDSLGGSEAVSEVELQVGTARGTVRLSWLSRYENTFTIRGDQGTIRGSVFDWKGLEISEPSGNKRRLKARGGAHSPSGFGPAIIDDFLAAITHDTDPLIPASEVLDSIRLIERCYEIRQPFSMPWNSMTVANDA